MNADATLLATLAAASAQHRQQVQVVIECERQSQEAAFFATQASIASRNNAAVAALFADWNLGKLDPRILQALGLTAPVLNVFNTARSRQHVAKQHPGDVEFIMQQTVHALANPYMFRRSDRYADRIELVGFAADKQRTLFIVLEAPAPVPPERGAHGWLQVSAHKFGEAKRRRAEKRGNWTLWLTSEVKL